jgi:predicted alpha/beta-hydrolase family hydrolase
VEPITIDTAGGPGRLVISAPTDPWALLLLGHGAGGGVDAFDLQALAAELPGRGIAVLRFEQPWRTAGRKVAGQPASLDRAWRAALDHVLGAFAGVPLVVGGRSAGARVACRCYAPPALGVVCLSFPLHPPGRPGASRIEELAGVDAPVLVVQGSNDPFGSAAEIRAALNEGAERTADRVAVVEISGAGHSFTPRTVAAREAADRLGKRLATDVGDFVAALPGLRPGTGPWPVPG